MEPEESPARRLLCDDVWSRILDSCDRSTLGNLNCASRELFAILSAQRQSISLQSFVRLAVRCSPARLAYYCDFVRCVDVGQLLHLGTAGFDLGDCNSFSPTRSNSDSSNSDSDSDSDSDDYPTAYVDYRLDLSDIPGVLRAFPNATRVTFEIRHQEFEIFCNLLCTREPESPVLHATNAAIPRQVRLQITFRVDSESRRHPRNPIPALLHAIDNTLRPIADVRIASLKAELDVIQLAINAPRFVELFCPEILVIETPRDQHYLPRGSYMKPADLGARIMHDNVKLITIAKLAGLTSIEVSSPTTVALLRAIAESSPRLRKLVIMPLHGMKGNESQVEGCVDWMTGLSQLAPCQYLREILAALEVRQALDRPSVGLSLDELRHPILKHLEILGLCVNEPLPDDISFAFARAKWLPQTCETPLTIKCSDSSSSLSRRRWRDPNLSCSEVEKALVHLGDQDALERACTVIEAVTTNSKPRGPVFKLPDVDGSPISAHSSLKCTFQRLAGRSSLEMGSTGDLSSNGDSEDSEDQAESADESDQSEDDSLASGLASELCGLSCAEDEMPRDTFDEKSSFRSQLYFQVPLAERVWRAQIRKNLQEMTRTAS